jgi:hypothetical protein
MSENIQCNYMNIKKVDKQICHDYYIKNTLSENIDYKALYELVKIENSKLVKQNIKLNQELDKYKMMYSKKS